MLHAEIKATIEANAEGAAKKIRAHLSWDRETPASVTWSFEQTGKDGYEELVIWSHARELLVEALTTSNTVGVGDVLITCQTEALSLHLQAPSGDAVVTMPRELVDMLIEDSIRACPSGSDEESALIEAGIDSLLAGILPA